MCAAEVAEAAVAPASDPPQDGTAASVLGLSSSPADEVLGSVPCGSGHCTRIEGRFTVFADEGADGAEVARSTQALLRRAMEGGPGTYLDLEPVDPLVEGVAYVGDGRVEPPPQLPDGRGEGRSTNVAAAVLVPLALVVLVAGLTLAVLKNRQDGKDKEFIEPLSPAAAAAGDGYNMKGLGDGDVEEDVREDSLEDPFQEELDGLDDIISNEQHPTDEPPPPPPEAEQVDSSPALRYGDDVVV